MKTILILALIIAGIGTISVMVSNGIKSGHNGETPSFLVTAASATKDALSRAWESATMSSDTRRKISRLDSKRVTDLPIPILFDVEKSDVYDSWGDARADGRTHEGTDIMAPRGAYIVSPTDAVVTKIGYGSNGGNYVYTANPGGERFYFAHLDSIPKEVKPGLVLEPGDLIGYVGNTGNASGGPTHLHFGIYKRGATNPYPRLTKEFSIKDRVEAVERMLEDTDSVKEREALSARMIAEHGEVFRAALSQKIRLSKSLAQALLANPNGGLPAQAGSGNSAFANGDLTIGSSGSAVLKLQEFLIAENKGVASRLLKTAGTTGTFGSVTKAALAEYQAAVGLPATGYFGSATRGHLVALGKW